MAGRNQGFFLQNNRFLVYLVLGFWFLGFNLQNAGHKITTRSTMKRKDKSTEQRFNHVNATNRNSFEYTFIKLVAQ